MLPGDRSLAQRAMRNHVLAAVYERAWRPVLGWALMGLDAEHVRTERTRTVQSLRLSPGDLVVDVACGPGSFTAVFADAVAPAGQAVGVDLSAPMLARARRDNGHPRATYLRAGAHDLPFPDGSVDAVNCYAALYLIPEPFRVLEEMVRVLRPGGRIALMASVASPRPWLRPTQTRVLGVSGLRMFAPDALTDWLADRGFTGIEQEVHGVAQYVAATAP